MICAGTARRGDTVCGFSFARPASLHSREQLSAACWLVLQHTP